MERLRLLEHENDRLKQLLEVNGISVPFALLPPREAIPLPPPMSQLSDSSAGPPSASNMPPADGIREPSTAYIGSDDSDSHDAAYPASTPGTLEYAHHTAPVATGPPFGPAMGAPNQLPLDPPFGQPLGPSRTVSASGAVRRGPGLPIGQSPTTPSMNLGTPTELGAHPLEHWVNLPSNAQPFLDEMSTRRGTDQRVQQSPRTLDHDQLGVDFILA